MVVPWLVLAGLALVAFAGPLLTGARALGSFGMTVAHQCVPGQGPLAWLGMHLALVRDSYDCPAQTLALGGSPDDVGLVIVTIALPVLVVHALGVALGVRGFSVLARGFARCGQLLRGPFAALGSALRMRGAGLIVQDVRTVIAPLVGLRPRLRALVMAPALRGPPLGVLA